MKTKIILWLQKHIWACKFVATLIIIPSAIVRPICVGIAEGFNEFKELWRDYFELMKLG